MKKIVKYLLLGLTIFAAGCYTPQKYEVTLTQEQLGQLQKNQKVTLQLQDATFPRPTSAPHTGPDVDIHLTRPFQLYYIPTKIKPDEESESK